MAAYQTARDLSLGIALALLLPLTMHFGIHVIKPEKRKEVVTREPGVMITTFKDIAFDQFYFYGALIFGIACIVLVHFCALVLLGEVYFQYFIGIFACLASNIRFCKIWFAAGCACADYFSCIFCYKKKSVTDT